MRKCERLNLGCGSDYRVGYVNVDHPRSVTKKDLAHDLERLPRFQLKPSND